MTAAIRVQFADDHELILRGLAAALHGLRDIEIAAPAIRSGQNFLQQVQAGRAEVLLLDARMPGFSLLSALEQVRGLGPKPRVIVVSAQADYALVRGAAEAGAAGYALKDEALSDDLPDMIRTVAGGGKWFSPGASAYLVPHAARDQLSDRQRAVLLLMADGRTPDEIAAATHTTVGTVYKVQHALRAKLGAASNEEALVIASRQRLVKLG